MKTAKEEVWKIAQELALNEKLERVDKEIMYKNMLSIVRDAQKGKKPKRVVPGDFLTFWAAYPLKVAREPAERAYINALKMVDHDTIIKGLQWYKMNKDDKISFAHAASWLNARRWEDGQAEEKPVEHIDTSDWPEWKQKIAKAFNVAIVNTWFKDAVLIHTDSVSFYILNVPKSSYQWIKDRYQIELNRIFGNVELRVKD